MTDFSAEADAARDLGIWNGTNPDSAVTRAQAAVMAYRAYQRAVVEAGGLGIPMVGYSEGDLIPTGQGTLRTSYRGQFGPHGRSMRFASVDAWEPPYVWTGRMRVHDEMRPPVFAYNGAACHYVPSIVFHPMWRADDWHVQNGFAGADQKMVSISGEIPGHGYGSRSGYQRRERVPSFEVVGTGWHGFTVEVMAHHHWRVLWDGAEIVEVEERTPATMSGPCHVALRLDFFDVELADMAVNDTLGR